MKRLIVFDLDVTLAESKSSLDSEMTALLHKLVFYQSGLKIQMKQNGSSKR
jgi:FMN phosphatase YigB (HAD superfamily)